MKYLVTWQFEIEAKTPDQAAHTADYYSALALSHIEDEVEVKQTLEPAQSESRIFVADHEVPGKGWLAFRLPNGTYLSVDYGDEKAMRELIVAPTETLEEETERLKTPGQYPNGA